eukprot:8528069-Pyramimonas_sp.AAC.1
MSNWGLGPRGHAVVFPRQSEWSSEWCVVWCRRFDFVSDPSTEGAFLMPVKDKLDVPHTMPLHLICKHLRAVNRRMQETSVSMCGSPVVNSTTQKSPIAACEDKIAGADPGSQAGSSPRESQDSSARPDTRPGESLDLEDVSATTSQAFASPPRYRRWCLSWVSWDAKPCKTAASLSRGCCAWVQEWTARSVDFLVLFVTFSPGFLLERDGFSTAVLLKPALRLVH